MSQLKQKGMVLFIVLVLLAVLSLLAMLSWQVNLTAEKTNQWTKMQLQTLQNAQSALRWGERIGGTKFSEHCSYPQGEWAQWISKKKNWWLSNTVCHPRKIKNSGVVTEILNRLPCVSVKGQATIKRITAWALAADAVNAVVLQSTFAYSPMGCLLHGRQSWRIMTQSAGV